MQIRRDKTALRRIDLSRPLRLALDAELLPAGSTVFDYGCGHGSDLRLLRSLGYDAVGWDPAHAPRAALRPSNVVNLGFVVNVIEHAEERATALSKAWALADRLLIVSARLRSDVDEVRGDDYADGVVTRCGTFQHFYTQSELRDWIEHVVEQPAVPAAPGVFLVFRSSEDRERFIAARFRRSVLGPRVPISAALYAEHKELLDPLLQFFTERGRLPAPEELANSAAVSSAFGSIGRAFAIVRRATGSESWSRIEVQRNEDLLLYLAHAQFNRPVRFTDLAAELRGDIRAFHGNYPKALLAAIRMMRQIADQDLINAVCKAVPVGKETPQAIYLHASAIDQLPTVLRLYEACARGLVGEVEGANIVKLHRYRPQVSYLCYPTFDKDAHPALTSSMVVRLDEAHASFKDYSRTPNPPILHRKEEFVPADYPGREKFAKLTKQEEAAGLFRSHSRIGFLREWLLTLHDAGVSIRGHRLVKRARSEEQ